MIGFEFLNEHEAFFLETTSNEKFEVVKQGENFLVKDIVPPVNEMNVVGYRSTKIKKNIEKQLLNNPEYKSMTFNDSNFLYFDGILKGFHFWFQRDNGVVLITKGKIEKCYVKQILGNFEFNIHLLENAGRKVNLEKNKGILISTDTTEYKIECINGNSLFEDKSVLGIYSLFNTKRLPNMSDLFSFKNEYDVSIDQLYINRPFIIFTKNSNGQINSTISFDNVVTAEAISMKLAF